jgi:membrane protein DedA with SNARE-associated domain
VFVAALGKSAALPIPGTTTLIAAIVLVGDGPQSIALLVVAAAVGATIGGHVGYAIGRHGGRRLLMRPGRWFEHRTHTLERGEAFWRRHGTKTVVPARFFPVLRHLGGVLAGIHGMRGRPFAVWNAAGAVLWALYGAVLAVTLGEAASGTLGPVGGVGVGLVVGTLLLLAAWRRARRRTLTRG